MKRGELITIAVKGDYGKPRPALIVQSDAFNAGHPSVTVLPITSDLVETPLFRVLVEPSARNGLKSISQIMIDKLMTVPRTKVGKPIGQLEEDTTLRVTRALALWLGLA